MSPAALTPSERIRGSLLTHAVGDALGAPFEFAALDAVAAATGRDWIDALYPFDGAVGPHGPWITPAPPGTGTDDVRYNRLFVELAVAAGGPPDASQLASGLLDAVRQPQRLFPGFPEQARAQFDMWEGVSRGQLGQASAAYPGVSPVVLATRSVGLNVPTIAGLLLLPSAGLLIPGDPEAAYAATYEAAFFDVGYAREATALFAAAQSLAVAGAPVYDILAQVTGLDPLRLGGPFGDPFVKQRLGPLLQQVGGRADRDLATWLSVELRTFGVFDPFRALAVAFAALQAHPGDAFAALQVAVNQVDCDLAGTPLRMADIDCHGSITGALVGTIHGPDAVPAGVVSQVLDSNRVVYGIDLEKEARRLAALQAAAA